MDRSEPPSPDTRSRDCFFIGKDHQGNWVVQDIDHRRGGLFTNCAAALKFAKSENQDRAVPVVMVTHELELDMTEKSGVRKDDQARLSYRAA